MPEEDRLDELANLIAGCDFSKIPSPDHRARLVELAIMSHNSDMLLDIRNDIENIGAWFKNSKLWDGL